MKGKFDDSDKEQILVYFSKIQKNGYAIRLEIEAKQEDKKQILSLPLFNNLKALLEKKIEDKSIYLWPNTANKWGMELRLYYKSDNNEPEILKQLVVSARGDRAATYTKRLNNNKIIKYLLKNGFKPDNF